MSTSACETVAEFLCAHRNMEGRLNELGRVIPQVEESGGVVAKSFEDIQDGIVNISVPASLIVPHLQAARSQLEEDIAVSNQKLTQILEIINS